VIRRFALWTVVLVYFVVGCATTRGFEYPPARRADVVDDYHGTKVPDPYRWLEDAKSEETTAWVEAQNRLTREYVDTPLREKIKQRLTEIWNYPKYTIPYKVAGRYFFEKNDGLQNQCVYYVQDGLGAEPRVILDPNQLSKDGTTALTGARISEDGKLMAYLLSHRGSDWQELKIKKIDTGEDFEEILKHCKFTSIAWKHDNSGFFYNRFPDPETMPPEDRNTYSRVYWHKLGTLQGEDKLIYTDLDAPRGRIVAIDTNNPDRKNWKEIVAEQEDTIAYVAMVNNHLVVATMKDARHVLNIYSPEGKHVRQIGLPGIGSVYGLSGRQDDTEMFFSFMSFTRPQSVFRYDFTADQVELFRGPEIKIDLSGYETKQVFYESKDGTRIPMFIVHKQGLALDGDNPTLLYGYGGFKVSRTPYFSISRVAWLENGGVFAMANIRGGGEYGEEWHQAGVLGNKQNVFDDFIAAGEWLIENKYTNSKRLAIMGGSNGGLLTAACMLQRPDLFGAVISAVPVADMLRYHKFSVGRYWVSDYGNAEKNPEHFKFLYAYSPVHNVKPAVYPPTLITTADTDDRVVPMHGKKFAAALQAADLGQNPILLRVETKAGHGGGKPTAKRIEESADIYSFLFKTFGMKVAE